MVKNLRPDFVLLSDNVVDTLDKMAESAATAHAGFAVKAMKNAALTGADQALVLKSMAAVADLITKNISEDEFVALWNQRLKDFQMVKTDRLLSVIKTGKGSRMYPVIGMYDRAAKRIISAGRFNSWKLECRNGSKMISFTDHSPETSFAVSPVKYANGNASFTITWHFRKSR